MIREFANQETLMDAHEFSTLSTRDRLVLQRWIQMNPAAARAVQIDQGSGSNIYVATKHRLDHRGQPEFDHSRMGGLALEEVVFECTVRFPPAIAIRNRRATDGG